MDSSPRWPSSRASIPAKRYQSLKDVALDLKAAPRRLETATIPSTVTIQLFAKSV